MTPGLSDNYSMISDLGVIYQQTDMFNTPLSTVTRVARNTTSLYEL